MSTGGAEDTIAAIATAVGAGAIGIIRLSGGSAGAIAARLIGRQPAELRERGVVHGWARAPRDGDLLDEVLVLWMPGPGSFTGEDVAEIQAHGGPVNLGVLLRTVVGLGARSAEPGEFTRRAFENGRTDLTRAEAVAEVIAASSEQALRAARGRLAGGVARRVEGLRATLADLLAELEVSIDFPEEIQELPDSEGWSERASQVGRDCTALAASFATGRALRDGVEVALVGAANVGKSSLLNALAGEERALVAAEPGTTRDYVEARLIWEGVPVTVIDTAGEREVGEGIERRGLELGQERAKRADLRLRVLDASCEVARGMVNQGPEEMLVWNKADLRSPPEGMLAVSALTGGGLAELRQAILGRCLGGVAHVEGEIVASERQRGLLLEASDACTRAAQALGNGREAELAASDLRAAATALAAIMGKDAQRSTLDAIFARFCVGK